MPNAALSKLTVSPNLALEFLATFSRLEYALKVGGFSQQNNGEAKANWIKFIDTIKEEFNPYSTNELQEAFNYLLNYSLERLEVVGDSVEWKIYIIPPDKSPLDRVILKIKQIRNNLFHGGKFLQSNANQNNDTILLRHSITVLLAIKNLNNQVCAPYDH